ncbi:MAG: DNA mismatch repair endonuclease MutL [Cyanobacteria bacterium]|nr:DNA mismatch repair endonuclease MutL [Cyanobacteriota bacterium]
MTQATRRPVKILPPHVVNKIAAGEVVERPASVIKELVENALDAGATKIEIMASAGGRNLRVADNGSGMTPEDVKLAFYNHATSKISEETDLSAIETLGFRGEALASIVAIAKVTCWTKTLDMPHGSKVTFDPLGEPQITDTGCANGTVLEVQDLFYNIPARLKFLKRPQTELNHIEETVQCLALSHPEIQFTLSVNDQFTLKTSGSGQLKTALEEIFKLPAKECQELISVTRSDEASGLHLAGYISPPGTLKSSKKWLITFVNGRYVKCSIVTKAIEGAYLSMIPQGKYPVAVLFLTLPSSEVDINVHPSKKEVRYVSPNGVFGFIRQNVLHSLEKAGHTAFLAPPQEELPSSLPPHPFSNTAQGSWGTSSRYESNASYRTPPQWESRPGLSQNQSSGQNQMAFQLYQPLEDSSSAPTEENPLRGSHTGDEGQQPWKHRTWKIIGQLFNTYILLETQQGLMVVDQHIASERSFFEAFTQATLSETPAKQTLLELLPLDISPQQADLLLQQVDHFSSLGFEYQLIQPQQENQSPQVILKALPIIYTGRQPKELFEQLLMALEEPGSDSLQLDLSHLIATLACHSAVRAGDTLLHFEMEKVIEQWLASTLPWTCPHGRPIAHTIETQILHQFFDRHSLPVNAR